MGVVIIGEAEKIKIASMIEAARKNPQPIDVSLGIAAVEYKFKLNINDFDQEAVKAARAKYSPQCIMIGSYTVCFSYETQPAGLVKHISISSNPPIKDQVPSHEAVNMIIAAFGFERIESDNNTVWLEEFESELYAVNVISLEEETVTPPQSETIN